MDKLTPEMQAMVTALSDRSANQAAEKAADQAVAKMKPEMERIARAACQGSEERVLKRIRDEYGPGGAGLQSSRGSAAASSFGPPIGNPYAAANTDKILELKNWVTDWQDQDASSLLKEELIALCTQIFDQGGVANNYLAMIDLAKTNEKMDQGGPLYTKHRIFLKPDISSKDMWSLKKAIEQAIAHRGVVCNGRSPKCGIQASESFRPLAQAAGRFYGALENFGLPKEQGHVKYMERERRVLVRAMVPGSSQPRWQSGRRMMAGEWCS